MVKNLIHLPHEIHMEIASWFSDVDDTRAFAEVMALPGENHSTYTAEFYQVVGQGRLAAIAAGLGATSDPTRYETFELAHPNVAMRDFLLGHFQRDTYNAVPELQKLELIRPLMEIFDSIAVGSGPQSLTKAFDKVWSASVSRPGDHQMTRQEGLELWHKSYTKYQSRSLVQDWLEALKRHAPNHSIFSGLIMHDSTDLPAAPPVADYPELLGPIAITEHCGRLRWCKVFDKTTGNSEVELAGAVDDILRGPQIARDTCFANVWQTLWRQSRRTWFSLTPRASADAFCRRKATPHPWTPSDSAYLDREELQSTSSRRNYFELAKYWLFVEEHQEPV